MDTDGPVEESIVLFCPEGERRDKIERHWSDTLRRAKKDFDDVVYMAERSVARLLVIRGIESVSGSWMS